MTSKPDKSAARRPRRHSQSQVEGLQHIIAESGLSGLLCENLPVDIARVAKAKGAKSITEADIPASGMLIPTEDSFRILLNRQHSLVRQRFSCAHELAHVILNAEYSLSMRRDRVHSQNDLERKCEALAALILMPDPTFSELTLKEHPSIQAIIRLARLFLTSIQATALRFMDVVEESCVLIVSKLRQGRTGFNLRVSWSQQNTRRRDGKTLYFVPRGSSLNIRTASIAHQAEEVQAGIEKINVGALKLNAYTESKGFGTGNRRYILTLVFPDRKKSSAVSTLR